MRKVFVLGVVLIVVVALMGIQFRLLVAPWMYAPAPWRRALDSYIAYLSRHFDSREPVVQVVKAERPWDFNDIGLATYGDTVLFATDQQAPATSSIEQIWHDDPAPVVAPTSVLSDVWIATPTRAAGASAIIPTPTISRTADSANPKAILPYPPSVVRCVQLRQTDGQSRIVFVARHDDLHWAEWVVHIGEATPLSADFIAFLEQIGCDLNLEASN